MAKQQQMPAGVLIQKVKSRVRYEGAWSTCILLMEITDYKKIGTCLTQANFEKL
jgi:hypothetical protein